MRPTPTKAFTIIELLVVVSIIALLIGILLPAVGRARDQARQSLSETNLRNLGTAHSNYSAEWNDRQLTYIDDNMSTYGNDAHTAFPAWHATHGGGPDQWHHAPPILLGWGTVTPGHISEGSLWAFWMIHSGNWGLPQPIVFSGPQNWVGFGAFRVPNGRQFNAYVGGRFYDPVFYAPKDTIVWDFCKKGFEQADEYTPSDVMGGFGWSSYCLSPAGMFHPDVMRNVERGGWQNPWRIAGGFRSPGMSQTLYPSLKTHMLEHSWVQNRRSECNPAFEGGTYDGCEPYYFNHGWESVPMTLFYDGHVQGVGTREAEADDGRVTAQTDNPDYGLWSRDTPFGGSPSGGYFMDLAYDFVDTSFHVLTTDGIRGRDKTGG